MLISGGADELWPSTVFANRIMAALHAIPADHVHLNYPAAGRLVFGVPSTPAPIEGPVVGGCRPHLPPQPRRIGSRRPSRLPERLARCDQLHPVSLKNPSCPAPPVCTLRHGSTEPVGAPSAWSPQEPGGGGPLGGPRESAASSCGKG